MAKKAAAVSREPRCEYGKHQFTITLSEKAGGPKCLAESIDGRQRYLTFTCRVCQAFLGYVACSKTLDAARRQIAARGYYQPERS